MDMKRSKDKRLEAKTRYRVESGKLCIELNLKTYKQLFDFRDPAPFRERDLDDEAARYIVTCAEEFAPGTPLKLVIHIPDDENDKFEDAGLRDAIHSFFDYESDLLRKQLRNVLAMGRKFLLIGFFALTVCLVLAQFAEALSNPQLRFILREGLVISGWVAMWRPIELFLYDWRPIKEKRKYYEYLRSVEVDIIRTKRI